MNYYVKKFISFLVTLFIIMLLSFLLFQVIPGDAALNRLAMSAGDEAAIEQLREYYGYNRSLPVRFFDWFAHAIRGDFGMSLQYNGISVKSLIAQRLPMTIWLAGISLTIIIILSISIGILGSKKENGIADRITGVTSQIFMAIPSFVMGIIITLVFGIMLKAFTPGRYIAPGEDFLGFLKFIIFPALAIAIPKTAMTIKFVKSSIKRERIKEYVRTARAKGNSDDAVLWKHILKNSLMPVITFLGLIVTEILAGSILIEQVFNLPGMGRLLITAISFRDFPVVQAIIFYIAVVVITVNFVVDVLYRLIDPRQE